MRSKEAIRKETIHYIKLLWEANGSVLRNPLVNTLIEAITNEVYLQENKLVSTDSSILDELVKNLAPLDYKYIRPAHSILYTKPSRPIYYLDKKTVFTVKQLPGYLKSKGIENIGFTSVANLKLADIQLTHMFHRETLWSVDNQGHKEIVTISDKPSTHNTVWLKLEVGPEVKHLDNLFFYIDFPDLPDHHEYFDLTSQIKWFSGQKLLESNCGLSLTEPVLSENEIDILAFYEFHYQTLTDKLNFMKMEQEYLPGELSESFGPEFASGMTKGYWLSMQFPFQFNPDDLDKLFVAINAFPVMNRQCNETRIQTPGYGASTTLTSSIGESFLEMDKVYDSNQNSYELQDNARIKNGVYVLNTLNNKDNDISDKNNTNLEILLEKLLDISQEERTAFSEINREKVLSVLDSVMGIQNDEDNRTELNRLTDFQEVGQLTVYPFQEVDSVEIAYWTSHVETVNGIPEGTSLMAYKVPEMNKSESVLITPVYGGRNFCSMEDLKALNQFFMMSKGRILSKQSIVSFCHKEIGKYIEKIDVFRKVVNSPKSKEGLIMIMEVQITPQKRYFEYFKGKMVLKDLLIRLRRRSPNDYNYRIKIMNE